MPISLEVSFDFLKQLAENNTREWFNEHKSKYQVARENAIVFAEALLHEIKQFDHIETPSGKKSLFRIYRDIRFSKDKSPYKRSFSGYFKRATNALRGGYYFHLEPGNTFIAGGFFGPSKEDLFHIRRQIDIDPDPLIRVLNDKELQSYFGSMIGDQLKTAPKGFPKNHPSIEILRYKQFMLKHSFNDEEARSKDFHQSIAEGFSKMLPFFGVMSEMLTTDLNGHPMI